MIIGYQDDWEIFFSQKINLYICNLGLKQNIIVTLDDYLLSWWLKNCFSKEKCISIFWGLKNHLLTLENHLLSCGGDGGSGCSVYCNEYIILL